MEEGNERNGNMERPKKYEFFSKSVRAGRRTYFFDVRATQGNDFYITITESKKNVDPDGRVTFEKHKIFLYPEDFDLYSQGLAQIISYVRNTDFKDAKIIKRGRPEYDKLEVQEPATANYSNVDVDFDDLGTKR